MTTLQLPKHEGGWEFPNIEIKCKTLLYNRLHLIATTNNSITTKLMELWNLTGLIPNPPISNYIPTPLTYLRKYAVDMAYIRPYDPNDSRKTFNRRIYQTLLRINNNMQPTNEIRIIRKYPDTDWARVWNNMNNGIITEKTKSTWYAVIHDILPTHDRLVKVQITPTDACPVCEQTDSVLHRITECGEGAVTRNWTRKKIGLILRTDPKNIPRTWTTRPEFYHWPKQKQNAVIWMITTLVAYRMEKHRRLSLSDYLDFLQRARWKLLHQPRSRTATGRYLELLDHNVNK
jgi:hypothetical protein